MNPGEKRLTEAVARYLFKLMAYKDEYEVARLHMRPEFRQILGDVFGKKSKVHYLLLPPVFRSLGMKKKIKLGRWFDSFYRVLIRMKFLRGTKLDIFGYAKVRKTERELIGQYRILITQALSNLTPENYEQVIDLANLPDMIRGYEEIKLDNVKKFWQKVEELGFDVPTEL